MKKILFILFACFYMGTSNAQEVVKLWNGTPPTNNEVVEKEKNVDDRISNVTEPDITIYLPEESKNKRTAIIICPGGGYTRLASQHEGHQFAQWLKSEGYAAIVLKYRLPNKHKNVPLEDFWQAIRYVRSSSEKWGVDKVGIAGFSAGGHLASTASTHYDGKDTRPDFSILFYPVITMGEYTHQGSKNNLLGNDPSEEDIYMYSNEKQVNNDTPPAILLLSDDDKTVPSYNSVMYYDALKQNNIAASMYIFPSGGHGWGIRDNFLYHNEMKSLLLSWLSTI